MTYVRARTFYVSEICVVYKFAQNEEGRPNPQKCFSNLEVKHGSKWFKDVWNFMIATGYVHIRIGGVLYWFISQKYAKFARDINKNDGKCEKRSPGAQTLV